MIVIVLQGLLEQFARGAVRGDYLDAELVGLTVCVVMRPLGDGGGGWFDGCVQFPPSRWADDDGDEWHCLDSKSC